MAKRWRFLLEVPRECGELGIDAADGLIMLWLVRNTCCQQVAVMEVRGEGKGREGRHCVGKLWSMGSVIMQGKLSVMYFVVDFFLETEIEVG